MGEAKEVKMSIGDKKIKGIKSWNLYTIKEHFDLLIGAYVSGVTINQKEIEIFFNNGMTIKLERGDR